MDGRADSGTFGSGNHEVCTMRTRRRGAIPQFPVGHYPFTVRPVRCDFTAASASTIALRPS
jgi:hypothetical protein